MRARQYKYILTGGNENNELIKIIIKNDFYVDDLIIGSNDDKVWYMQTSISNSLKSIGFKLRKFKSNSTKLFQNSNLYTEENLTLS